MIVHSERLAGSVMHSQDTDARVFVFDFHYVRIHGCGVLRCGAEERNGRNSEQIYETGHPLTSRAV
jgi:hypothetical protein